MKLSIDVMGFENDLNEAILACRRFQKLHDDVELILVGDETKIKSNLKPHDHFEIINTTDVIEMNDNPLTAARRVDSSMYQAIKLVADNKADGVLSAGSTAVYVSLVYYLLKLIPGVNKPAFMPYLPTVNKKGLMLLDVGANKECTGEDLYQFALMACIYCKNVRHINNPSIGVINIGTEENKGLSYHQKAHELLKQNQSLHYLGFVEPRTLLEGNVDIAVTDGFIGNITLKSLEGGLKTIQTVLKTQYKKPWNWFGAIASIFAIKATTKTFDYRNHAGALVLGLQKTAVKTHGSADKQQFYSGINTLYQTIKQDVIGKIKTNLGNK